jgi:hypothetical protein
MTQICVVVGSAKVARSYAARRIRTPVMHPQAFRRVGAYDPRGADTALVNRTCILTSLSLSALRRLVVRVPGAGIHLAADRGERWAAAAGARARSVLSLLVGAE